MADKALESLNTSESEEVQEPVATEEVAYEAPAPAEDGAQVEASAEKKGAVEAVADLSKFSKVKLDDRELTLDELKNGWMMQSDYTKKTQEIAKERKYYDNLEADLRNVKDDPSLIGQFKKVYPEKFHRYLDFVGSANQAAKSATKGLDPDIESRLGKYDELLEKVNSFENTLQANEAKALEASLEVAEKNLAVKYPYADSVYAYTLAQEARNRWEKENGRRMSKEQINEQWMEPFFKKAHEYQTGLFKKYQEEQVKKVKQTNKAASDVGRGGGVPGQAPAKIKLKDVSDYILNSEEMG